MELLDGDNKENKELHDEQDYIQLSSTFISMSFFSFYVDDEEINERKLLEYLKKDKIRRLSD